MNKSPVIAHIKTRSKVLITSGTKKNFLSQLTLMISMQFPVAAQTEGSAHHEVLLDYKEH